MTRTSLSPPRRSTIAALPCLVAVAVLSIPSARAVASDGWQWVRPQGCYLAARMPAEVTDRSGTRHTVVGDIAHRTISADHGEVELSLTVTDLPGAVTALAPDGMLFRRARNALVENYDGTVASWSACERHGIECRWLTYEVGNAKARKGMAQLYLDDGVLVVLNAVYPDHEAGRASARAFLRSARP